MKKIKLGLVGCGVIAQRKYFKGIRAAGNECELVAVCDFDREKAEKAAEFATGAASIYTDVCDLLKDDKVEAVIIATPHPTHADLAVKCATAGKHMLIEKPMAISMEEVDEMIAVAKNNKVKMLILPFVKSPTYNRCDEFLRSGLIGDILYANAESGANCYPPMPWFVSKKAGFGALGDLGIYSLSPMIGLLGPALNVKSVLSRKTETAELPDGRRVPLEVEDCAQMILELKNGVSATLSCGWNRGCTGTSVTIVGRKGVLILSGWENNLLYFLPSTKDVEIPETAEKTFSPVYGSDIYKLSDEGAGADALMRSFADSIINDRNLDVDIASNRSVMEALFKGYESKLIG